MYDLVTFDIFDTLVHRKLRAPVDVFEAVRVAAFQDRLAILNHSLLSKFTEQRIQAEHEAREKLFAETQGESEVTFREIYDRYQENTGCRDDFRQLLERVELKLEKLFLFASARGLEKYNELKAGSHRVAFISDMYLPSEWLGQMLEDVGFEGASTLPIFVSCELRKSKHSGAIFPEVRERLSVTDLGKWVHVGDNPTADIMRAQEYGIKTILADWAHVDNRLQPSERRHADYLINSLMDFLHMPQARQFFPEEEYAEIGYKRFGPMIFGFMLWILAKARESKIKRLVFVARDGWLPYQLFDMLRPYLELDEITTSYICFSRRIGIQNGLKEWDTENCWIPIGGRSEKPLRSVLETAGYPLDMIADAMERHNLSADETITAEKHAAVKLLLDTTFSEGLKLSLERRNRAAPYFDQHLEPGVKTGIVDIGWHGNIQRLLIGSLDDRYAKEDFVGFYLGLHSGAAKIRNLGFSMNGWVSNYGKNWEVERYLQEGGVELLEFALTADHGTGLGFRENSEGGIEPILEDIASDENVYREKAMKVQSGIRKFVEDYAFLLEMYDPSMLCSTEWSQAFKRLVTDPQPTELRLLTELTHSDGAGGTSSRKPLATRLPEKARKSQARLQQARENAFWKVAFDRLNS